MKLKSPKKGGLKKKKKTSKCYTNSDGQTSLGNTRLYKQKKT